MFLIIPITTEKMNKMFVGIEKQAKAKAGRTSAAFPLNSLAQMSAVLSSVTSIASALVASIYPVCLIWFLTRPAARAACLAGASRAVPWPGREPSGP
jgi:hypothetical protein